MRRPTRAQEKTTPKHSGSQLPFYCRMIVVQNRPHAPGLLWLWHTPWRALQFMGEHDLSHTLPWSCFPNNHSNRTLFSMERGATHYLKPKSSFAHDSVHQVGHRTAQGMGGRASLCEPQDSSSTLDTLDTWVHLSLQLRWRVHRANQVRFGLRGTNTLTDLDFIYKLIFFSCQVSYRFQFRQCFYDFKELWWKIGQASHFVFKVLDMFTMVYFTPCWVLLGSSIS